MADEESVLNVITVTILFGDSKDAEITILNFFPWKDSAITCA